MNSETALPAGADTSSIVASPTGRGGEVEENGGKESNRLSKGRGLSGDEEEEGGFVSGEEELDTASERGKFVTEEEEEDMDVAFVEPPEVLKPVSMLSEDEEEDEVVRSVEDEILGVEDGGELVAENGFVSGSVVAGVGDEPEGVELGSSEKPLSEVVAERGIENVELVGDGLVEVEGAKFAVGDGSVIEGMNVAESVSEPRLDVVKPVVEASSGSEKPEENFVETKGEELGEKEAVVAQQDESKENAKEDRCIVLIPSNDDLSGADEAKVTCEGDAVVEATQVDLHEPGLLVVNGSVKPETTILAEVKQSDDHQDRDLSEEDRMAIDTQTEDDVPVVGGESNSPRQVGHIIDNAQETKESEIKDEKVLVNGGSGEVEEKLSTSKPKDDAMIVEDVKLTTEVDSIVEAIHLNVAEPGVVVVEDSKESEKPEVKTGKSNVEEAVELNNGFDVTANGAEAEVIHGTVSHVDKVINTNDNEKPEMGTDQDGTLEEANDVDQSACVYNAEHFNQKGNGEDDDGEKLETGMDHEGGRKEEANVVDKSPRAFNIEDLDQEENGDDEIKRFLEEAHAMEGSPSDEETDGMIFGSSEAAKQFLDELEKKSVSELQSGAEHSQMIDGQIVTDSDEEVDTDEEGSGKELFNSAALAALLKAATGGGSDGNVTLSAQDVSSIFSGERPAGLGSSLRARPAPRQMQPNLFSPSSLSARGESENNLSEEERKKLEKIQQLRVKFLRLVYRLGQSPEDSIASQVLYRLLLLAGRPSGQAFSLDAAKRTAQELENQDKDSLNFSLNILVIGKSGVGKSATINSIFGENKAGIDAFEPATTSVKEITGNVDGVHIRVFDTPGLKTSVMDQGTNRKILASVKKSTKKCPPDIVLYVDRLDSQTRDLNDLPMLRTITSCLGSSIWRSAIVTLTHAASAPPDGPSGTSLSYEVFVAQRSHAVQQSVGQAVGDLRLMNPSLMNPVSLAENHPSCRRNRDGLKVLPNGQAWRPQLLMFCYSMKILSEASALYKQQDPFDHQKLFGFRVRAPPLPYLLSWLLQSRTHPKLSDDQGGGNGDSDVDLDDLSESEGEEEDEYDQLPPFKPLRKSQLSKLNKEQLKAYYEEYDYRVKLLQKKQWKEELKRMKDMRKGKAPESEYLGDDADAENGAPAAVPVPLPDMVLPPSFDSDNPAYRYRFLEPSSQFLARPVLDNHGWDHDCGYDGVNLEQSLAIAGRFPTAVTVQVTKDKKEFNVHLDSSVAAKHGENASSMAGFDIQNIGKKLAYIVRGETKFKHFKKNKTTAGFSVTFLGENIATGVKIEDQFPISKRLVLVGSTGTVRSQKDAAYGANLEIKLREADFPIGQDQSSLGLSLVKWRGDLALGANLQSQISVGRGSKVAVRVGLNNKSSGQITVRTSTSDQLQIALIGIFPLVLGIYRAILSRVSDDYGSSY